MKLSITQASGKYTTIRGRQSMLVLINYSLKMSRAAAGVESLYILLTDPKKTNSRHSDTRVKNRTEVR